MAIHVEIEKSFKGFSLKTAFDSKSSATGILGAPSRPIASIRGLSFL